MITFFIISSFQIPFKCHNNFSKIYFVFVDMLTVLVCWPYSSCFSPHVPLSLSRLKIYTHRPNSTNSPSVTRRKNRWWWINEGHAVYLDVSLPIGILINALVFVLFWPRIVGKSQWHNTLLISDSLMTCIRSDTSHPEGGWHLSMESLSDNGRYLGTAFGLGTDIWESSSLLLHKSYNGFNILVPDL